MITNNVEGVINDRVSRKTLASQSHYYFFNMYFSHYVKYQTADFQKEMFQLTEDSGIKNVVIVAFRGSAKSTIMTLSYPIWAMIGKPGKKFIIILSQTQQQARLILKNIKRELESNPLLISDFGPFGEDDSEWRSNSLVIPKYQTRIMALSSGESIRGSRHLQNRPDLIIADDVEDLESVKTREGRNKTFNWLTGDVIPAGDNKTKFVIIGNLLHEDSLIKRLEKKIKKGSFTGIFKAYPLIEEDNNILWPGKYPDMDSIKRLKKKVPSEAAWQREYLLNIISDEERVVHPEWIKYYGELPPENKLRYVASGVDLAISQKETADKTAIVSANIYGYGSDMRVCILPNPVNERLTSPETYKKIIEVNKALGGEFSVKTFIEDVGYQKALIQDLNKDGYPAEPAKVKGQDKRARLSLTTHHIKQGRVLFPKKGAKELIEQLVGFGVERYDDLADAFSILVLKVMEDNTAEPQLEIIDMGGHFSNYKGLSFENDF